MNKTDLSTRVYPRNKAWTGGYRTPSFFMVTYGFIHVLKDNVLRA